MHFDELIECWDNKKNFEALVNKYREGQQKNDMMLVPFVGAGLSAFAYPTWWAVLQQLIDEFGCENTNKLKGLLENNKLEKVVDILAKDDERKFYIKFREIYGLKTLSKYQISLFKQSVGLLPFIFPSSLIMTSNFDPVIEAVYNAVGLASTDVFQEPKILSSANNRFALFKIHGDVLSGNDNIIFSQKSYKRFYRFNSELVTNMKTLFRERSMLFLGASLINDRTLDVLKMVSGISPHFAIIECDWNEISFLKRRSELSKLGIYPIFYPKGDYECVSIILKRLLNVVNAEGKIENKYGVAYIYKDGYVANNIHEETEKAQIQIVKKQYESFTPEVINGFVEPLRNAYRIYTRKKDEVNLPLLAENLFHLVRMTSFHMYKETDTFNPFNALKQLVRSSQDEYVIRLYAESMIWHYDLYCLSDLLEASDELQRLYNIYTDEFTISLYLRKMSLCYAIILSHLVNILLWKQYAKCERYVMILERLYLRYGTVEFATSYAEALWCIHLGELQENHSDITEKCISAKMKLRTMLEEQKYNLVLVSIYAKMLVNLVNMSSLGEAETYMSELFNLFIQVKSDDVAIHAAEGLLTLSLKYDDSIHDRIEINNTLSGMSREYSHVPQILEYTRCAIYSLKLRIEDMRNFESSNFDPANPMLSLNDHVDMVNGKTVNLTPWYSKDKKKINRIKAVTIPIIILTVVSIILGVVKHLTWLWIIATIILITTLIIGAKKYLKILGDSFDKLLYPYNQSNK